MNNHSVGSKRKPNSHTKLPKIKSEYSDTISTQKSKKQGELTGNKSEKALLNLKSKMSKSKSDVTITQNPTRAKLQPIKKSVQTKIEEADKLKQINVIKLLQQNQKDISAKHKILKRNAQSNNGSETLNKKPSDDNINKVANKTVNSQRTKSEGSSQQAGHIVFSLLSSLVTQNVQSEITPDKLYAQKKMGETYADWWCVVDSIFLSLQKAIKIKKIAQQKNRIESPTKNNRQIQSPLKNNENGKKKSKKNDQPIKGTVASNIKASLQLSHAYSCLESESFHNQKISLKAFQDPNHISLVLESYFYEKACIYLLGSIKKWHHQDEKLLVHNLAKDLIPCIRQNRRLLADIIMQAVENQLQDTKIRKPKYIARQKKLIQISKFVNLMKQFYEKCMHFIGSPNRYKIFYLPEEGFKDHEELRKVQVQWRHIIFNVPSFPYIKNQLNGEKIIINGHKLRKKQYMMVIQPLGILYKYNKKQETLFIYPYAQNFLSELSQFFHIVLFTYVDKEESMLNFLGCLQNKNIQIPFIFDKEFMRYRKAKLIKDLSKIGGGEEFVWDDKSGNFGKVLVMDQKINCKYYSHFDQKQKQKLYLVQGNHAQTRLGRVGGRLVKIQEDNQDFLKNLAQKIIKCASEGGHWSSLIKDQIK